MPAQWPVRTELFQVALAISLYTVAVTMSRITATTALATIQPAFTDAERLALAGFLAGYRGLTREVYALDLRQFTTWCRARSLSLFAVRRPDIESFARESITNLTPSD